MRSCPSDASFSFPTSDDPRTVAIRKHPFYIRGNLEGYLALEPRGDRVALSVSCNDDQGGIYRGVLYGEKGRLSLGTLIPKDGQLMLHCVLPSQTLDPIGTIQKGEAVLSFPASAPASPSASVAPSAQGSDLPGWRTEPTPERLFDDPVLMEAAKKERHAWIRQEKGVVFLALPWEREFPLVPLFCFAQIMRQEEKRYAVFALDSRGMPVV
jgi:hypothetical protein